MTWKVSKFTIHFDLWEFDSSINNYVDTLLATTGIIISSTSWT